MLKNNSSRIHDLNCLTTELDSLYHQAAVRLGLSDSVLMVLYALYDSGGCCLLSNIYKQADKSRQTINSAVRKLEAEGIIYLEAYRGRSKKILLTDKGREYADGTVAHIYAMENDIFVAWSRDEFDIYIRLFRRFIDEFRENMSKLPKGEMK